MKVDIYSARNGCVSLKHAHTIQVLSQGMLAVLNADNQPIAMLTGSSMLVVPEHDTQIVIPSVVIANE